MRAIDVSVCVIAYNQEDTIRETLDSILQQKANIQFEVIIGNDCSTDRTKDICEEYVRKYPSQVRLFNQPVNLGLMRNYDFVTLQVRGKYFGVCAGDDFWHNDRKIQLQYDYMQAHPKCGLVHSGCNILDVRTNVTKECIAETSQSYTFRENLFENRVYALTSFYRTDIFRSFVSINKYIELGFTIEDYPSLLDISFISEIGYIPESLATYRYIEDTISRPKDVSKHIDHTKNVFLIKNFYLNKANADFKFRFSVLFQEDVIFLRYFFKRQLFRDRIKFLREINWLHVLLYYIIKFRK